MAESIQDGSGNGYRAKVNSGNQLSVLAATIPLQHHNAHIHKKAFSMVAQQTPTATNDAFVYLKNEDSEDLNVWEVCLRCAAVEAVEIWSVTGTAVGTDYTPVNVVVGSGVQPQVTCKVGNDITGLTKSKLIKRYWLEAGKAEHQVITTAIIVPESHAVALYAVTGTALTDACMTFDFHSEL